MKIQFQGSFHRQTVTKLNEVSTVKQEMPLPSFQTCTCHFGFLLSINIGQNVNALLFVCVFVFLLLFGFLLVCLSVCFFACLFGCLVFWLVGWLVGWF